MELFDAIKQRYSHKGTMNPDVVPSDDELRRMVEAGMAAPSAMNKQSPEFIIITERAILERIGWITGNATLASAPAMIAVVSYPGVGEDFYREDYAAATENILLAATALGYAVGWIDGIFRHDRVRLPVSEILGIPDDRLLSVVIPVGKPAEAATRRAKKPFEERASWNRYDVKR